VPRNCHMHPLFFSLMSTHTFSILFVTNHLLK
jgi:hypothetical protein